MAVQNIAKKIGAQTLIQKQRWSDDKLIANSTWVRVDMEFLFELNTRREIPYL